MSCRFDQARLDDLLARNAETQLTPHKITHLDQLLEQVDQLNILKTRARYTLTRQHELATAFPRFVSNMVPHKAKPNQEPAGG